MDQLKVDTADLRNIAAKLSLIHKEFDDADSNSDELSNAVGESNLAGKIHDFAHNWDIHRKKMMGDIETLIKSLNEGADALEKTDNQLAASLTGDGKGANH